MKRQIIIGCVLTVFFLIRAGALETTQFDEYITDQKVVGNELVLGLSLPSLGEFKLSLDHVEIQKQDVEAIVYFVQNMQNVQYLGIDRLQLSTRGRDIPEIVVLPDEFTYGGYDFMEYLPEGLRFYYGAYLEYDFRVFKDNLIIRLKSQFFDEEKLCKHIQAAVEDPVGYLQKRDPEYIVRRLAEISKEILRLNENESSIEALAMAFNEQKDISSAADIKLADDIAGLEQKYETLAEENRQLEDEIAVLRYAFMAYQNGHLFKPVNPIVEETLSTVLELVRDDPELIKSESAVDEINSALKAKDIRLSKKAIRIILAAYYGVY